MLILVWGIVVIQTFVNFQQKKEREPVLATFSPDRGYVEEMVSGYGYLGDIDLSDTVRTNIMRNLGTLLEFEEVGKINKTRFENMETWSIAQNKDSGTVSAELTTVHGERNQHFILIKSNQKLRDTKKDSMFQAIGHAYQEMGVNGKVMVEQVMEKPGNQMTRMKEIEKSFFEPLRAKEVNVICKNGICTVYGYTKKESTFFLQNEKKVNVQLVLLYDQGRDCTIIKLGIPMVNSSY